MDEVKKYQEKLDKSLSDFTNALKDVKEEQSKSDGKFNDIAKQTDEKIATAIKNMKKENADLLESVKKNNVSLDMEGNDIEKFSFGKAVKGIISGDWSEAEYELDVFNQTKAQDTNSGVGGGYLIPVELAKEKIIMPSIANTVMKQAGAEFWDGLVGDIDIPESTNRPTLTFGADGVAATLNTLTFGQKPLRPKAGDMFAIISNKLMHQSNAFIEKVVTKLMQEGTTTGLDEISLNGLGSESEPRGILQTANTNTLNVASQRMTQDNVGKMIEDIQEVDWLKDGKTALITRPKVLGGLRREKVAQYSGDTLGFPIVVPMMSDSNLADFTGTPILTTTSVAVSSNLTKAVMGEWKKFIIATWAGMRMKKSTEAGDSFRNNQTYLLMNVDVDTLCTVPTAFNIASNISTNF